MTTPAWAVTARRVLHAAALCLGVASTAHGAGWQAAGSYTGARYQHTSTQLADGRVLLAGGRGSGVLASTQLYDTATGRWTSGPALPGPRAGHTATPLLDGTVLIAGGEGGTGASVREAATLKPACNCSDWRK